MPAYDPQEIQRLQRERMQSMEDSFAEKVRLENELAELNERIELQAQLVSQAYRARFELEDRIRELEEVNGNLLVAKLQMSHLAHHDFLTGLPNRAQFEERLAHVIALAERNQRKLAVLFLDLDRFKNINDSMGHNVGDKLLKCVTERLQACVRNSDILCRQGGDEFVILLSEIEHEQDAVRMAEKILESLAQPVLIDGNTEIRITTSIGISIYPYDTADAEALIRHADTAMYVAKENGRNQYRVFTGDMNARIVARQQMEHDLLRGFAQQEFVIAYQPRFDLHSRQTAGVEALVRWQHPQRGLLYPAQFMQIALDSGMGVKLGQWMLQQALVQAKSWHEAGYEFGRVSVNVSDQDFHQVGFVDLIRAALDASGLKPELLELEITENVLLQDGSAAVYLLQEITAMGVCISIDDFGTGFSSLSYLKQLPIHVLKIDRSFLSGIGTSTYDAVILSAIIRLGNSLNLDVIAEGIETDEQEEFLRQHHCHLGQGFNYSPPVSAQEVVAFFNR